jgi:hypothetical protein
MIVMVFLHFLEVRTDKFLNSEELIYVNPLVYQEHLRNLLEICITPSVNIELVVFAFASNAGLSYIQHDAYNNLFYLPSLTMLQ